MKRVAFLAVLLILIAGCAEQRFIASIYADRIAHRHNPKVLVFSGDINTGQITGMAWGRLCDVADCTMRTSEAGAGIVTPTPSACYGRWWKECDHNIGKHCRAGWWDRCAKQEEEKAAAAAKK